MVVTIPVRMSARKDYSKRTLWLFFSMACLSILVFAFSSGVRAQTSSKRKAERSPESQRGLAVQPNRIVKALPGKSKRFALIIGVDSYSDGQITALGGAANDARLLASALVRYAGFPEDQVMLLASDQPVERQPTRSNVLQKLSNLVGIVPSDGLLLLAFSGHGIERGGQVFLLPSDARLGGSIALLEDTAIKVTRVKDMIREVSVNQVILILDACRNDPAAGRSSTPNPMTEGFARGFSFDVRNQEVSAFVTLYATAVGDRAYEYTEKGQGYFTWALIDGLTGSAANASGEVTLSALIKHIQETVPKRVRLDLGKSQRPFAIVEGYKADELVIGYAAPVVSRSEPPKPTIDPPRPAISEEPKPALPVDVNAKDASGRTPLMRASLGGDSVAVKALLAKGADANAADNNGATPLMNAAHRGSTDLIHALLAAGANVNAQDKDGTTALMIATLAGHTVVVRALLDKGADVNLRTKKGTSALQWAEYNKNEEITKLLKKAGAKK